jgi:hypothetical protein
VIATVNRLELGRQYAERALDAGGPEMGRQRAAKALKAARRSLLTSGVVEVGGADEHLQG